MNQDSAFVHDSFLIFQNPYICLMTLGWEKCKPSHTFSGTRDTYTIHFVRSGKGTLFINGCKYNLKKNDAFLIRPQQYSEYIADEKDPWTYCYFSFAGVLAYVLLEETGFKNNNVVINLENEDVADIIGEGLEVIRESDSVSIKTCEYLFKLLSALVLEPTYVKEDSDSIVKKIENHIKQNYMKDIQINEIAKAFNMSRNHIFRMFKNKNGISLKAYISNIKLQEAKRLLISTNIPITQISEMLGYKTYSSFFKMFKSFTNYTPKEYREIKRKTNDNPFVDKSNNGIYHMESDMDSINYHKNHDTEI